MAKRTESNLLRTISTVMILSLVMSLGAIPTIEAASLTDASDTMADSSPSATTTHTFDFTTAQAIDATGYIEVTFDGNFDTSGVAAGNVTCPSGGAASINGQNIRCTFAGGFAASTTQLTVANVVSPAKSAAAGVADTYTHYIRTYDSGDNLLENAQVMVAIIDQVTVTASIDATLQFTVAGLATSTVINDATTTFTSTSTTLPFGVVQPGAANIEVGGQELTVTTNADYGFVVTVEQDQNLTSGAGSDIDSFDDGSPVSTPKAWESPSGTLGSEATYGHMGLTSDDANLASDDASYPDFTGGAFGGFNSTDPYTIFAATSTSDGSTQNIGLAKVAYQIEISSLQEAGDYTNTLMYICTPSY